MVKKDIKYVKCLFNRRFQEAFGICPKIEIIWRKTTNDVVLSLTDRNDSKFEIIECVSNGEFSLTMV